ncbi:uroporphyrin-III C-methyltransferase [Ekhidna lutea]|uniref:uroporphyrinogen-III C-methyltransferase n=1 Tax=Ekhidna lutea TaxID=447679 RepID=A0A239LI14_EKHLU|nr:uroporphyrinogen-III C-methyltransferase [Ekhidna lutea]SNT30005.1 uroporphyrin-III C-methyltransferase [Ekhidna lutea]
MSEHKLTLVGTGPGDPDLITIKGVKALEQADVVLYDALVSPELLRFAPCAEHIPVGKRAGKASLSQETINSLIVDKALNKGHVVRLKGGDPFVFGRGFEELQYAEQHGIDTEVVIGISSIMLPGLYGIPLTCRGVNQGFSILTATSADGSVSGEVGKAAKTASTALIFMGLSKLDEVVTHYLNEGRGDLPVAIISNGSLAEAQVIAGTVNSIVDEARDQKPTSPALLIFGEGAAYAGRTNYQTIKKAEVI